MPDKINLLRNPEFVRGKDTPAAWDWVPEGAGVEWERAAGSTKAGPFGVRIASARPNVSAWFVQEARCRPGDYYRVEAEIRCELQPGHAEGGAALRVEPTAPPASRRRRSGKASAATARTSAAWSSPAVVRASQPVVMRAYFHAPADVGRVAVSVGIRGAAGWVEVRSVRFIRILEPEHVSHPYAILPPAHVERPSRVVERVCVCSASAEDRPLTDRLRAWFGAAGVVTATPDELAPDRLNADALLLPDEAPPRSIRSLAALRRIAEARVVVISLRAFARLTRKPAAPAVRCIEQEDDPIHARVVYGHHATQGYALHDAFAWAWAGKKPGSFRQNHLRNTKTLQALCQREGLTVFLDSLCDREATSEHPVALFRQTDRGGLYVLDLEPAEADGSTMGEPVLAMRLLLTILGQELDTGGQYITPVETETGFRDLIREFGVRFPYAKVHDADVPSDQVTEQIVTVGGEDQSLGLPLSPRPVILLRSGLTGGDIESTFGCLLWIKQLVRPAPHGCPYVDALCSRFRIAWVPSAARWSSGDGWQRSNAAPAQETSIETRDGALAALIDIASRPQNRIRVVLPREDEGFAHYLRWLPALYDTFAAGRSFLPAPPPGEALSDRSAYAWRRDEPRVEVVADPDAFGDEAHRDAMQAGGQVIRIEAPGFDADFSALSIRRTATLVALIEMAVGLQVGLIAVNRGRSRMHFDGFHPVPPGEALIVDRREPALQQVVPQAG